MQALDKSFKEALESVVPVDCGLGELRGVITGFLAPYMDSLMLAVNTDEGLFPDVDLVIEKLESGNFYPKKMQVELQYPAESTQADDRIYIAFFTSLGKDSPLPEGVEAVMFHLEAEGGPPSLWFFIQG